MGKEKPFNLGLWEPGGGFGGTQNMGTLNRENWGGPPILEFGKGLNRGGKKFGKRPREKGENPPSLFLGVPGKGAKLDFGALDLAIWALLWGLAPLLTWGWKETGLLPLFVGPHWAGIKRGAPLGKGFLWRGRQKGFLPPGVFLFGMPPRRGLNWGSLYTGLKAGGGRGPHGLIPATVGWAGPEN